MDASLLSGRWNNLANLANLTLAAAILLVSNAAQAGTAATCTKVIITGDSEFPPYSWYDGAQMHGAGFDIVTRALDAIHLPYEVRYTGPFPRVLAVAQSGGADIIVELKDTPERRAFLQYSSIPIFTNPSALFTRKGSDVHYKLWNDLERWHGGYTHGTKFGGGFDDFLATKLNIEEGPGIKENFIKLQLGRIDYFVTPYYPGLSYLIAQGHEADFVVQKPFVAEAENYVGWSKRSPCLGRLDDFDRALIKLSKRGVIPRMIDSALDTWRDKPVTVR